MKDKHPYGQLKDNLQLMRDARKGMSPEEVVQFYSFFVGSISGHIETALWESCIETAKDCLQSTRGASSV